MQRYSINYSKGYDIFGKMTGILGIFIGVGRFRILGGGGQGEARGGQIPSRHMMS